MLKIEQLSVVQNGVTLWSPFSLDLQPGERLGIAAPSGFGKTTLGRVLAQWQRATSGQISIGGLPLTQKGYCPIQLVPQHPEWSFNPLRSVGDSLQDAWQPSAEWLADLQIDANWLTRRPAELSGGQLARIALLRALDPRTRYLIADEVTAQVDAKTQVHLWHTLLTESRRRPLGLIIFSHNDALLERVCTTIWRPTPVD